MNIITTKCFSSWDTEKGKGIRWSPFHRVLYNFVMRLC